VAPREPLELQILRARLRAFEERGHPGSDALRARLAALGALPGYLLFVPETTGYALVERAGSPPVLGSEILVDDRRFVLLKLGASPLPGDRRRCAFLSE
jgi:hypothetical protein